MPKNSKPTFTISPKIPRLVLYGSLGVGFVLVLLLLAYDLFVIGYLRTRSYVALFTVIYLIVLWLLTKKRRFFLVSWMLILLYGGLAFSTLLYWGLHSAIGIFATSFVIALSGVLLGSKAILPVSICTALLFFVIQTFHSLGIVTPDISAFTVQSTYFDVITYITILAVFALITWVSDNQNERTLERAKIAESAIRSQKESLALELEKESVRLRQIQLKEMQELYKFATLGQSTAATLHELSNHLSILNLDIDDLKEQHKHSKAIANAQDGIEQINLMVRKTRRKLDSFTTQKTFKIHSVIQRTVKDAEEKFASKQVKLSYKNTAPAGVQTKGDTFALMQVVTILLNNALDACYNLPNAAISITLSQKKTSCIISVKDNGVGISPSQQATLFMPSASSKPAGLGVGLYIARHLTETQLHGTIKFDSKISRKSGGACFVVSIPIKSDH